MGEPIQTKTYDYVQAYKANTRQAALAPGLFLIDSPGAPSPQSYSDALHPCGWIYSYLLQKQNHSDYPQEYFLVC